MSGEVGGHRRPGFVPSGDFGITHITGKYGAAEIFEGNGHYSATTHRLTVTITNCIIRDFAAVRGKIHVTGKASDDDCPDGKFFNDYAHSKVSTDKKKIELWN